MSQEMTDTELDREWKPNGRRPQSTMARSLAATLDNVFMLDSEVDSLTNSIHYKQQVVSMQSRELEALEARIRATENRLRMQRGEPPLTPIPANSDKKGDNTNNSNNSDSSQSHTKSSRKTPQDISTANKDAGVPPLSTPNQSDDGFVTNASTSPATTDQDEDTANHAGIHGQRDPEINKKGKERWS